MSNVALPECDDGPIWRIWLSAFHAPSLAVAEALGLFRALQDTPLTVAELAERMGVEVRVAESLAALLTSLDLLVCMDARYHLAEVSRHCLLPASPYYWGGFLDRIRNNPIDCAKLIEGLRRGTAAAENRISSRWELREPDSQFLRGFTHAMHAHSFALAVRAVPKFRLEGVRSFLDVGGGSGSYCIAAALRHPELRCTVLDFGTVCEVAREYANEYGVAERVGSVVANMFADEWPHTERVFLSDILHDWDDERCRVLAQRGFAALPAGGRLLAHEMLLSDANDGPLNAAAYSAVMVFAAQGRQRTARAVAQILESAGFSAIHLQPTAGGYALIEGVKT